MKEIAVTGGKGGTGKSTFAVLYALKLVKEGKKVVLVDVDVECPNDYLLLGANLGKEDSIFFDFPEIIEEKCDKCGACAKACTRNALFFIKGKIPNYFENLCDACGTCFLACKKNAIRKIKKKVGSIFENKINENLVLVSGRSEVEQAETSRIVSRVRERAREVAEKFKADFILIDSAPGVHCSVISALFNVDKVFCVTEPTPLGVHDLEIIFELLEILKVKKVNVIINKADLGYKSEIYKLLENSKFNLFKELPYSEELIRKYSRGELKKLEGFL